MTSFALALAALFAGTAQAAAPLYAGTLGNGSFSGSVAAESGPHGTPQSWSYWRFNAPFMGEVAITVTPTDAMFDPFIAVWYGTETDTANYVDMNTGSLNSVFVTSADGIDPFSGGGAGEAAALRFRNLYGGEAFVLAVADYSDGLGSGDFAYTITASVPEPSTYAMWLGGFGLMAAALRRRVR
jgi:hypothetical protein